MFMAVSRWRIVDSGVVRPYLFGGVGVSAGTMLNVGDTVTFGPVARYRSLGRFGYALEAGVELAFTLARSAK